MMQKHPVCPERIRKVPKQFSQLDHRLVRDHYIEHCSHQAAALYLFLVTVADAQGFSYYSDNSISQRLGMDADTLVRARRNLIQIGLVAYKKPLHQVPALDIPRQTAKTDRRPASQLQSLGQILKQLAKEAS